MRLNLGCSDRAVKGFAGVDIAPPADQIVDLSQPWPWLDSSVDEIVAYDIIEHLPDRIQTMNELWRVLKPGARVTIEVPNAAKGAGQWQDPTHVSQWCMNSWQYFEHGNFAQRRFAKAYGIIASFRVVSLTERPYKDAFEEVWKITAVLEAVKC
jgi:predicted SAM-dependent methyltransferase